MVSAEHNADTNKSTSWLASSMSALPILGAHIRSVKEKRDGSVQNSQGWGCSPIKRERELGLDRRETGRILSIGLVGGLKVREN